MKKVIVTGATGFIGRFLVRELVNQNVEVIAVVRKNSVSISSINNLPIKVVECDICNYNCLSSIIKERDIDTLFHTAWQGVSDRFAGDSTVQIKNLLATLDLIDEMQKMSIGCFVGCGSMHEVESFIEMKQDKVITNLGYMYKASKVAAHWMAKAKCGNYGIRFFWPLINTYGEEEKSARLINTVIRKIYKGESPEVSKGDQLYDFVHVSDVAKALCLIAEKGIDGSNYVIGSGEPRPIKEFLNTTAIIANKINGGTSIPVGFGKYNGDVISLPISTFDISKIQKDTGFIPQLSFEEGITTTALWIKENQFE